MKIELEKTDFSGKGIGVRGDATIQLHYRLSGHGLKSQDSIDMMLMALDPPYGDYDPGLPPFVSIFTDSKRRVVVEYAPRVNFNARPPRLLTFEQVKAILPDRMTQLEAAAFAARNLDRLTKAAKILRLDVELEYLGSDKWKATLSHNAPDYDWRMEEADDVREFTIREGQVKLFENFLRDDLPRVAIKLRNNIDLQRKALRALDRLTTRLEPIADMFGRSTLDKSIYELEHIDRIVLHTEQGSYKIIFNGLKDFAQKADAVKLRDVKAAIKYDEALDKKLDTEDRADEARYKEQRDLRLNKAKATEDWDKLIAQAKADGGTRKPTTTW